MYLEQEAALLSEKIKKHTGNKKQNKKHWKKSENRIIKQKHIITSPIDK